MLYLTFLPWDPSIIDSMNTWIWGHLTTCEPQSFPSFQVSRQAVFVYPTGLWSSEDWCSHCTAWEGGGETSQVTGDPMWLRSSQERTSGSPCPWVPTNHEDFMPSTSWLLILPISTFPLYPEFSFWFMLSPLIHTLFPFSLLSLLFWTMDFCPILLSPVIESHFFYYKPYFFKIKVHSSSLYHPCHTSIPDCGFLHACYRSLRIFRQVRHWSSVNSDSGPPSSRCSMAPWNSHCIFILLWHGNVTCCLQDIFPHCCP